MDVKDPRRQYNAVVRGSENLWDERLVYQRALRTTALIFFASCALVSLSLSVTGERDEKQSEDKEDAVQPN